MQPGIEASVGDAMIRMESLGEWLAIAQHIDKYNSWPWYGRWFHKVFVSWRCPCCKAWRVK